MDGTVSPALPQRQTRLSQSHSTPSFGRRRPRQVQSDSPIRWLASAFESGFRWAAKQQIEQRLGRPYNGPLLYAPGPRAVFIPELQQEPSLTFSPSRESFPSISRQSPAASPTGSKATVHSAPRQTRARTEPVEQKLPSSLSLSPSPSSALLKRLAALNLFDEATLGVSENKERKILDFGYLPDPPPPLEVLRQNQKLMIQQRRREYRQEREREHQERLVRRLALHDEATRKWQESRSRFFRSLWKKAINWVLEQLRAEKEKAQEEVRRQRQKELRRQQLLNRLKRKTVRELNEEIARWRQEQERLRREQEEEQDGEGDEGESGSDSEEQPQQGQSGQGALTSPSAAGAAPKKKKRIRAKKPDPNKQKAAKDALHVRRLREFIFA